MPSTLFPSVGAPRNNKPGATYFYRSKYLLAPDPSALAQPGRFVARKDHHHTEHNESHRPYCGLSDALSGRRDLGPFNNASLARVRGTWKVVTTGSSVTLSTSSGECKLSFPPPPTLADILCMEPDLSLTAALMRAYDHLRLNISDFSDASTMSATDMQTRHLNVPEVVAVANEAFRIAVERSPIVHEQGVSQVSGVQGIFAVPPSASLSLERGPLCDQVTIDRPLQNTRQGMTNDSPILPSRMEQNNMDFKTLTGWLADYLQALLFPDEPRDSHSHKMDFTLRSRNHAVERIYTILRHTLPSVSAIFLALWYIGRLPVGFVFSGKFGHTGHDRLLIDEVIVRSFVVGSILANRWLEDFNFSAKYWHRISSLPLSLINQLEVAALVALDYSLHVSSNEWNEWLMVIRAYHSSIARFQPISRNLGASYVLIRRLMDETLSSIHIYRDACPRRGEGSVRVSAVRDSIRTRYKSGGLVSVPPVCAQGASALALPLPAPWLPEADPIVSKASRTIGTAPGVHCVQNPLIAMSPYEADNTCAPRALACVVDMLTWRGNQYATIQHRRVFTMDATCIYPLSIM